MIRGLHRVLLIAGCATMVATPALVHAQMSSTNYQIPWDTVSSGGNEQGESTNYEIVDTLGLPIIGFGEGASYQSEAGYRAGDERALSFSVGTTSSTVAGSAYSTFVSSTKTITVSGGAAAFSVGSVVALVENAGLGQMTAVGKIAEKSGSDIILDRVDGQVAELSQTPIAGSASLFTLDGAALSFGTLSTATAAVGVAAISVTADTANGYTVFTQASGRPTDGTHELTPVTDGAVATGSEEYGIRTYGSTSPLTGDVGVTSTSFAIQVATTTSAQPADRVALVYKLAINSSTPAGTYAQSLFFTLTPNY